TAQTTRCARAARRCPAASASWRPCLRPSSPAIGFPPDFGLPPWPRTRAEASRENPDGSAYDSTECLDVIGVTETRNGCAGASAADRPRAARGTKGRRAGLPAMATLAEARDAAVAADVREVLAG